MNSIFVPFDETIKRVRTWLEGGGLQNPDKMSPLLARDLIIECRDSLLRAKAIEKDLVLTREHNDRCLRETQESWRRIKELEEKLEPAPKPRGTSPSVISPGRGRVEGE